MDGGRALSGDLSEITDLNPRQRILLGPGPSNVHPRVLRAMATPMIGHLDPDFLEIMNETKQLLQQLFQTQHDLTFPISGTGSAGMEACLTNLIEPGDTVLVCVNGAFGERMADIVRRNGGDLGRVEAPWGSTLDPEDVVRAARATSPKIIAVVHAETSTGVLQPLSEIGRIAREYEALLLVDTVTSLGGFPVTVDDWQLDAVYSGTQKCLSCPPGLAPVSFSDNAVRRIEARATPVQSWYLDVTMVRRYWSEERFYHHTAPISMIYALREALRLVMEEGLDARFARHRRNHEALVAGLEAMGLSLLPQAGHRLWMLNAVKVPDGVNEAQVRKAVLKEFDVEIGGGLGVLKGRIWRIGLMGYSSTENNVLICLAALERGLAVQGFKVPPGGGVSAALEHYARAS